MLNSSTTSLFSSTGLIPIMKILILFFSLMICFSCSDEEYVPIDVSTTDNLAMSNQWAVISEPYVSYMNEASTESVISSYGRIGDVVEIIGTSIGDNNILWYKFENGWLSQSEIHIFANKLQANFAAQEAK